MQIVDMQQQCYYLAPAPPDINTELRVIITPGPGALLLLLAAAIVIVIYRKYAPAAAAAAMTASTRSGQTSRLKQLPEFEVELELPALYRSVWWWLLNFTNLVIIQSIHFHNSQ